MTLGVGDELPSHCLGRIGQELGAAVEAGFGPVEGTLEGGIHLVYQLGGTIDAAAVRGTDSIACDGLQLRNQVLPEALALFTSTGALQSLRQSVDVVEVFDRHQSLSRHRGAPNELAAMIRLARFSSDEVTVPSLEESHLGHSVAGHLDRERLRPSAACEALECDIRAG